MTEYTDKLVGESLEYTLNHKNLKTFSNFMSIYFFSRLNINDYLSDFLLTKSKYVYKTQTGRLQQFNFNQHTFIVSAESLSYTEAV